MQHGRRYYSRRHFERLAGGPPDTAETIAERIAWGDAARLAIAEREARFPDGGVADPGAMIRYQDERQAAHYHRLLDERGYVGPRRK